MKKYFLTIPLLLLMAACGRSPRKSGGEVAGSPATQAGKTGVMQDGGLVRTVEEMRRDSAHLHRIDSLARLPQPSYATPREAVEAQLRAYVAVDAPLLFHVSESGFERTDAQQVLDYQHMMEGLARRHLLPTDFAITEVGGQDELCPVEVDLTMPDGTVQPMHTQAFRLDDGRWRPLAM